jgi:hypothetical protein
MAIEVVSPGMKLPQREADHSLVSVSRVKNRWSFISIRSFFFMAVCLYLFHLSISACIGQRLDKCVFSSNCLREGMKGKEYK